MHPGQGKSCVVVIERRIQPRSCVVALLTGLREVRVNVIWVGRALIILQVARDTRYAREVVVIVDMAVGALTRWHGMTCR